MPREIDANDIYRNGELGNIPPEAVPYKPNDRVLVWAQLREPATSGQGELREGFVAATVEHFSKGADAAFKVLTHDDRHLSYLSAARPLRGTFCLALPQGTCGNNRSDRCWVELYAIDPSLRFELLAGSRDGWRGLLVGPGARAMGSLLATRLGLLPDADDSSLQGGGSNGECYWLFLQETQSSRVRERVRDAARQSIGLFLGLHQQLSDMQELHLGRDAEGQFELKGPNCSSRGMQEALRAKLGPRGQVRAPQEQTRLHGVQRERLTLCCHSMDEAERAVRACMRLCRLPESLLRVDGAAAREALPSRRLWATTSRPVLRRGGAKQTAPHTALFWGGDATCRRRARPPRTSQAHW